MQNKLEKLLEKSYSPYSGVQVSAILTTKDGKEYTGVNIENASFSPTVCAERTAIFKAVSEGYKKGDFKSIDLTSSTKDHLYPCGVCRQVMTEFFEPETEINVWNSDKKISFKLKDLMPNSVTHGDLK